MARLPQYVSAASANRAAHSSDDLQPQAACHRVARQRAPRRTNATIDGSGRSELSHSRSAPAVAGQALGTSRSVNRACEQHATGTKKHASRNIASGAISAEATATRRRSLRRTAARRSCRPSVRRMLSISPRWWSLAIRRLASRPAIEALGQLLQMLDPELRIELHRVRQVCPDSTACRASAPAPTPRWRRDSTARSG